MAEQSRVKTATENDISGQDTSDDLLQTPQSKGPYLGAVSSSAATSSSSLGGSIKDAPPTSQAIEVDMLSDDESEMGAVKTTKRRRVIDDSDDNKTREKAEKPRYSVLFVSDDEEDEDGAEAASTFTRRLTKFKKSPVKKGKGRKSFKASEDDNNFLAPSDSYKEEAIRSAKSSSSRPSSRLSMTSADTEIDDDDEEPVSKKSKPKVKSNAKSKAPAVADASNDSFTFLTAAERREQDKKDEKKAAESPHGFLQDIKDKDGRRPGDPNVCGLNTIQVAIFWRSRSWFTESKHLRIAVYHYLITAPGSRLLHWTTVVEINLLIDLEIRRGLTLVRLPNSTPTYDHPAHPSACRVYGTIEVKKVTANLHITTLGHGCAGVIDAVFVCMSYAIRITTRAVNVVIGGDEEVIVAASSSGAKAGLRSKWGGGELCSRNKMIRQGSGWIMESNPGSPALGGYGSYTNTPVSGSFSPAASPYLGSPAFGSPAIPPSNPGTPTPSATSFGPPPSASSPRPPSSCLPSSRPSSLYHSRTPGGGGLMSGFAVSSAAPSAHTRTTSLSGFPVSNAATLGSPSPPDFPPSIPGTPSYSMFPPTPNPANGNGECERRRMIKICDTLLEDGGLRRRGRRRRVKITTEYARDRHVGSGL
ncbi:hypothetical protein D9757_012681 [Collybiopsis confluens]|uniref:Uncharacterized protein n=1 Tax=Collybiopsis confluens TaxID=2823264 RepID=A0A8H5G5V4_9AGAR|nr:hypothetical protein D9757_012681 [Collybiopsis confluens]